MKQLLTPADAMLAEFRANTTRQTSHHQAYEGTLIWLGRNLNDPTGLSVSLNSVRTPRNLRRQGRAARALTYVTRLADKFRVSIVLTVAAGSDGLDDNQLIELYARWGFKLMEKPHPSGLGAIMVRKPS